MALPAYWLALFTGTHIPIDPGLIVPGNDKTLHFASYAGLSFLFHLFDYSRREKSLQGRVPQPNWKPVVGSGVLLGVYGAFDEITQPLVGRTCDYRDWLADAGGILIGLLIALSFIAVITQFRSAHQTNKKPG